jgi:hypothetical protein
VTEYSGTPGSSGVAQIAAANPNRRRLKYQNNGSNRMNFSATTASPASSTFGLAVPGGQNQIYEWPSQIAAAEIVAAQIAATVPSTSPGTKPTDLGAPPGAITVWGTSGDSWYAEEA